MFISCQSSAIAHKGISYLDIEEFKAGLEVSTKRINNVLVPMRAVFTMAFKEGSSETT